MIDINKMSIKEIDDYCDLIIMEADLSYILSQKNRYKDFKKAFGKLEGEEIPKREMIKYLEENEQYVDKEKLILISLKYYKELEEMKKSPNMLMQTVLEERGFMLKGRLETAIARTKECAECLRGKDIVFLQRELDKKNEIRVISSKQLLEEPLSSEEMERKKTTKKMITTLRFETILEALLLANEEKADKSIFTVPNLGEYIFEIAAANSFLTEGLLQEEITQMIAKKMFRQYCLRNLLFILPEELSETFEGVEQYIDMDKMCLNAFMDIVSDMENKDLSYPIEADKKTIPQISARYSYTKVHFTNLEQLLSRYYTVFSKKEVEIKRGEKTYTVEDAKKAMEKYIDGKYMSEYAMDQQILKFMQEDVPVSVMTTKQLQHIKQYIVDKRGFNTIRELNKMLDIGLMDGQKVLKMYEDRRLSLENMSLVGEHTDFKSIINPQFILKKLDELEDLDEEKDQDTKETIKRYMNLYKQIVLDGKTEEELIKAGKDLLQALDNKKEYSEETKVKKQEGLVQYGLLSERTLGILADQGNIEMNNFIDKYQKGYIHIETIKKLSEEGKKFEGLDLEQRIIDSYMTTREQENPNLEELKRYVLLYTELNLKGLSEEEQKETADEFIMKLGERIENEIEAGSQHQEFGKEDRKRFYELGMIPIDTVVLWADKDELVDILTSEMLIPKDIRRLYAEKRIILPDIQEIIENNDVSLEQKISLINIIFSTPEEADTRNELFEKITDLDTTIHSENSRERRHEKDRNKEDTEGKGTKTNKYIFDTAVRYNAFIEVDENVKMEIFQDGHIAAHLPNIKGGIVVIEQLYKLKRGKNGQKSMGDAYGNGGFVLTEEEYERYEGQFITPDNRVKRTELGKIALESVPNLEEKGIMREIAHFKHKYPEEMQMLLGVPEFLAKARTETQREKALKLLQDSEEYTEAEKALIMKRNELWEQVRKSRGLYSER